MKYSSRQCHVPTLGPWILLLEVNTVFWKYDIFIVVREQSWGAFSPQNWHPLIMSGYNGPFADCQNVFRGYDHPHYVVGANTYVVFCSPRASPQIMGLKNCVIRLLAVKQFSVDTRVIATRVRRIANTIWCDVPHLSRVDTLCFWCLS